MWYMKDYNIERPDRDYPGYDLRMMEGKNFDSEDFEEVDDDFIDERELPHYNGE